MQKLFLVLFIIISSAVLSAKPPSSGATGSSAASPAEYTIQSGDSLYAISRRFHTTVKAIEELNGLSTGAVLRPGQKLKIPGTAVRNTPRKSKPVSKKKKKPAKNSEYKVEAGDTPSTIAQRFGISTEALRQANGLKKDSLIRVGQMLKIPGGTGKKATTATAKKSEKKEKVASRKSTKKSTSVKKESSPGKTYTVQSGDTLFSIARKYHTPLNDLMSLNGIAPTDIIKPGQELKIPSKSYKAQVAQKKKSREKKAKKEAEKPKKIAPVYYTVKRGDVPWKIAKRHGITVAELRKLNHMKRGHILHVGEKLIVKAGTAGTERVAKKKVSKKVAQVYTVRHGDSLWKIARKHKVSVEQLKAWNNLGSVTMLRSGMKLTVGYKTETKVAKKEKTPKKKVAAKSRKKTKKVATARKSKSRRKKSANRRINSAMAAINGKGSGGHYSSAESNKIIRTAKRYLGRRYVWGAEGPSSFDCSGFTQYVMRKSKGVKLPRVSRKQAYYGKYVTYRNLKPGDLIFFDTSRRRRGYVNHVGIYIGNHKFIHASSARHRVVITSFTSSPFYRSRFKWGRRVN